MSSGEASTSPRPSGLTLAQMMVAVGLLAVAFAFLPWELSGILAITIFGILVLKGLRLPLLTVRGGMWSWLPWVLGCLSLAACPVAMVVVPSVFPYTGPSPYTLPPIARARPWAYQVVGALGWAHLGASIAASMSVVVLVREGSRWIAWGVIMVILVLTGFVALFAGMATTGEYF